MAKILHMVVVASLVAAASTVADARGGGGGGGMGGGMGGMSGSHMSSQGLANTNGPDAADRDTGLSRAEDRQSMRAASHEKAAHKAHRNSKSTAMNSRQ